MKCLITGCGLSVRDKFEQPEGLFCLGINDCEEFGVKPNHLMVLDEPRRFELRRRTTIQQSQSEVLWYFSKEWEAPRLHPDMRLLKVKAWHEWREKKLLDEDLPGYNTSMIPAIVLAYRLGYRDIAVTGCDLTGHWTLEDSTLTINQYTRALVHILADGGATVVNASWLEGRLTALPRVELESWATSPATQK